MGDVEPGGGPDRRGEGKRQEGEKSFHGFHRHPLSRKACIAAASFAPSTRWAAVLR